MQKIKILVFIVAIFSITIPIQAKKSKKNVFKQKIDRICRMLEHPFDYKRRWAAEQLVHLGPIICPYLAKKYSQCNYLAKREIVDIWHQIGDERSIKYIFAIINDRDEGVRMRVASSILELSDTKSEIITALKNLKPRSLEEQNTIQEIIDTVSYKQVENELAKLVSNSGGHSVCASQYKEVCRMGNRVVIPLLSIFSEDNYHFIHLEYERNHLKAKKMKLLAGYALAELDRKIVGTQRAVVLNRLNRTSFHKDPEMRRAVACILKKFGYSKFWKKIVNHDKNLVWEKPGDANSPYHLGMMYLRVNRNLQSIRYFKRAIFLNPHDSLAYYRLACAQSRRNEKKEALFFLQQAFDKGFNDYAWAKKDPDLKNLHGYSSFPLLMQKMKEAYEENLEKETAGF